MLIVWTSWQARCAGHMHRTGAGRGSGFNLNMPLKDGLRDQLFTDTFTRLVSGAAELYKPDCVVMQW